MEQDEEKKKNDDNNYKNRPKQIKINLPSPFKLALYIIIILSIFGVSVFTLTTVFNTQEKLTKFGLEDVGELVTQTCHTTVLEDSKVNRSFFSLFDIPFTESRQIFSYDFDVDASIDFSKVSIKSIDKKKKEIIIEIPHSKIYKPVLLPRTFKSYLDSESLFSRIDLTKHNEALIKMEEEAKITCIGNGLLEHADANAEKLISVMIKGKNTYKDYNVIFKYIEGESNEKS